MLLKKVNVEGKDILLIKDACNNFLRQAALTIDDFHINPHLFRHTMASILIAKKADIATVSRRLGHSSPSVTLNLYTEEIKKADALAADEVESLINRVCEDEENK